jgi:RNA polymerase sigma-70 factor (ECF subfamily)
MGGDPHAPQSITVMLRRWSTGDRSALEQLTPLVYAELRGLADAYMRRESHAPTLQPTALIHEAYIRLIDQGVPDWNSRSHFFRFSAHLMRQVLVDHARTHGAAKRGAGMQQVTLSDLHLAQPERSIDLILLDQVLDRLADFDERHARVVELRYFGGLSEAEAAETLGISVATVRRDLRLAEAWLAKEMNG